MKSILNSKTIITGAVATTLGSISAIDPNLVTTAASTATNLAVALSGSDTAVVLNPDFTTGAGITSFILGIIMIYLRFKTTGAVSVNIGKSKTSE